MPENILVTGGAGYIGSHAVVELLDKGYNVVVIDSLENGYENFVDKRAKFYKGNIMDRNIMKKIFSENKISVVMHFAGYISVEESTQKPEKYYTNNSYATLLLLEYMKENSVKNIIFSSTAAVYGEISGDKKVDEKFTKNPINPYGKSKLMAEDIIIDFSKAYNFNYVIFRYFNVAGAHEKYSLGQKGEKNKSLIKMALETLKKGDMELKVFGNDFPTLDGTGVRDYIHVVDLVNAHILGLKLLDEEKSDIFNLGNGNGFSVLEIVKSINKVTKRNMKYKIVERRKGDPAAVVASSEKANSVLGWCSQYKDIDKIIETAWNFIKNEY